MGRHATSSGHINVAARASRAASHAFAFDHHPVILKAAATGSDTGGFGASVGAGFQFGG
ncbi:MAG TPA: hypothetical protein VF265_03850 [Nevskiaceae bacterium]